MPWEPEKTGSCRRRTREDKPDGKEKGGRGREGRSGKGKKNYKKIDGVENCGAKFRVSF
jgi:hypothetical protein